MNVPNNFKPLPGYFLVFAAEIYTSSFGEQQVFTSLDVV